MPGSKHREYQKEIPRRQTAPGGRGPGAGCQAPGSHCRGGPAPLQPESAEQADRDADGPGQEGPQQAAGGRGRQAAGKGTGGPPGGAGTAGDGAGGKTPPRYAADPPDDRPLRANRQG